MTTDHVHPQDDDDDDDDHFVENDQPSFFNNCRCRRHRRHRRDGWWKLFYIIVILFVTTIIVMMIMMMLVPSMRSMPSLSSSSDPPSRSSSSSSPQQRQQRQRRQKVSSSFASSTLPSSSSSLSSASYLLSSSSTKTTAMAATTVRSAATTTANMTSSSLSSLSSLSSSHGWKDDDNDDLDTDAADDNMMMMMIPNRFRYHDDDDHWKDDPTEASFPRWQRPRQEQEKHDQHDELSSPMTSLLDYINITEHIFAIHDNDYDKNRSWYIHLIDHEDDIINWIPEILYIWDQTGIYISARARNIHEPFTWIPQTKFIYTDEMMQRSYQFFFHTGNDTNNNNNATITDNDDNIRRYKQHRWPRLYELYYGDDHNDTTNLHNHYHNHTTTADMVYPSHNSIPFLMWFGDYTGCNYHNWNHRIYHHKYGNYHKNYNITTNRTTNSNSNSSMIMKNMSVPLFTVAAAVDCHYTVPYPNYQTYRDAKETSEEWQYYFANQTTGMIPYQDKISQVVWRGSLTGYMSTHNESQRGIRYHVLKYVHNTNLLNESQRNMFNIKCTYIPYYNQKGYNHIMDYISNDHDELGIINASLHYMSYEYMTTHYKALLDMDGNSWSSRFGQYLCNGYSVVLKIQPHYVDYFYYKRSHNNGQLRLRPWVHYVPIRYDLSDFVNITEYVLSHDDHMKWIIDNAKRWCTRYMMKQEHVYDFLDVMESYVTNIFDDPMISSDQQQRHHHHHHHEWQQQWQQALPHIMNGSLGMERYFY